ncbi:MAG: hypothetical protein HYY18_08335 [Planctomycetes bacterium]|nr:hypothetical protein [Planctomycetota bacterium]
MRITVIWILLAASALAQELERPRQRIALQVALVEGVGSVDSLVSDLCADPARSSPALGMPIEWAGLRAESEDCGIRMPPLPAVRRLSAGSPSAFYFATEHLRREGRWTIEVCPQVIVEEDREGTWFMRDGIVRTRREPWEGSWCDESLILRVFPAVSAGRDLQVSVHVATPRFERPTVDSTVPPPVHWTRHEVTASLADQGVLVIGPLSVPDSSSEGPRRPDLYVVLSASLRREPPFEACEHGPACRDSQGGSIGPSPCQAAPADLFEFLPLPGRAPRRR